METINIPRLAVTDAELVAAARNGDPAAFRDIVARYQVLVCSLAYSGTGSLPRSEDIAQETFVTAWRNLRELREPGSLRSWLCGIARRLTSNAQRRAAREPTEPCVPVDDSFASDEPAALDRVIGAEEKALLWESIGSIPETYREPLILFYREQRSVAQVAKDLELSEDAVKQRLSRGRAMLAEQVLRLVEGTLEQTRPKAEFTAGVMAIVSSLAPASVGVVGGPSAKALAAGTKVGAFASSLGLLALPAALGACAGWLMRASSAQSDDERLSLRRMWQMTVIAVAAVIMPTFGLLALLGRYAAVRLALSVWLSLGYVAVGLPFAIWAWQNHLRSRRAAKPTDPLGFARPCGAAWFVLLAEAVWVTMRFGFPSGRLTDIPLGLAYLLLVMPFAAHVWTTAERRRAPAAHGARTLSWVAVATAAMAGLLVFSILDMGAWRSTRVSTPQARDLIAAHPDAKVYVLEYQEGQRSLTILVPSPEEPPRKALRYFAPLPAQDYLALQARGVPYKVLRQGENFELLGTPGRLLFLLAGGVVVAGSVLLISSASESMRVRRARQGMSA